MQNPFVFEEFATGEHFCGRREELRKIKQLLSDRKNVLLYSRRRYGKSSLIKELFERHLPKNRFLPIYVDLFEVLEAEDFARLFYGASATAMGFQPKKALRELVGYFSKVNFSFTLGRDGTPRLTPVIGGRDADELIADAFDGIEAYGRDSGRTVVVAFDEFQQINTVKDVRIDAIIRKHIQAQRHTAYLFSGSKQHMLTGLFRDQKSPLCQMATSTHLGGIDIDVFHAFVNEKLEGRLDKHSFAYLYDLSDGESKLIQQVCYHLFYSESAELRRPEVDDVIARIVKESDAEYRMLYDRLARGQRLALRAIVVERGRRLLSHEVLRHAGASKQSLASALAALLREELIDREDDVYTVTDRKFELWLRALYGAP